MSEPTRATAYRVAAFYAGLLALGSVLLAPLGFFPPRFGRLNFTPFWLVLGLCCYAVVLFLAQANQIDRAAEETDRQHRADHDNE